MKGNYNIDLISADFDLHDNESMINIVKKHKHKYVSKSKFLSFEKVLHNKIGIDSNELLIKDVQKIRRYALTFIFIIIQLSLFLDNLMFLCCGFILYFCWMIISYYLPRNPNNFFTKGNFANNLDSEIGKRMYRCDLFPSNRLDAHITENFQVEDSINIVSKYPYPQMKEVRNIKVSAYTKEEKKLLINRANDEFGFICQGNDKNMQDDFVKYQLLERLLKPPESWRNSDIIKYELCLDILKLSFWQWISCDYVLGCHSTYYNIIAVIISTLKPILLYKWGFHSSNLNYRYLVAEMLLETALVTSYFNKYSDDNNNLIIGVFVLDNLMLLNNDGSMSRRNKLIISVDLKSRCSLISKLVVYEQDNHLSQQLHHRDTYVLLSFHLFTVIHPIIQAYSNWASLSEEIIPDYELLTQCSCINIYNNYFLHRQFPFHVSRVFQLLQRLTIIPNSDIYKTIVPSLQEIIKINKSRGVDDFNCFKDIAEYSDFSRYHVLMEPKFKKSFEKHLSKKFINARIDPNVSFPLYFTSCFYSASVFNTKLCTKKLIWTSRDSRCNYSFMANIAMIFHSRLSIQNTHRFLYKNINTSFHRSVYESALEVDSNLADTICCCVLI